MVAGLVAEAPTVRRFFHFAQHIANDISHIAMRGMARLDYDLCTYRR